MIIEIRKCGFQNKGAQLMLLAIVEQLRRRWPQATLVVVPSAPGASAPFTDVTSLGLSLKASLLRRGIEFGHLAGLVPAQLRHRYGLYVDREVDVVLDAAGFAYSDQWGNGPCVELGRVARRWRRQGTKIILMPQAFGPFSNATARAAIRRAVADCDLVMPRDPVSYRYLTEVTGERDSISQYPDFTNLLEGEVPEWFDPEIYGVAIVPNYRMIDMTDEQSGVSYVQFLTSCAARLATLKANPYLLVHEGADDEKLARQIAEASGGLPVVAEPDPLRIKGIIGSSYAVVASRFHALVSALSQGVPAVATGWSHKYTQLFEDYGIADGVMSIADDVDRIDVIIERLVERVSHDQMAAKLAAESMRLKQLSEAMWFRIQSVIDGGGAR